MVSGYPTLEQIEAALMQRSADPAKPLGEILVERRTITPAQLDGLLEAQALGRVAQSAGAMPR